MALTRARRSRRASGKPAALRAHRKEQRGRIAEASRLEMAYMLAPLSMGIAIVYTVVGIASLFYLGEASPWVAYPVIFGSAFAFYAVRLLLPADPRSSRGTLPLMMVAVLFILATPVSFLVTTGDEEQLLGVAIVALGAGFLVLNLVALLAIELLIVASFVAAIFVTPDAGHWIQSSYSIGFTVLAGVAIFWVRRKGVIRLADLTYKNTQHRTVLSRALNEAQESERRFRLLSGAAFEAVVAMRGAEIRDINPAGAALFGGAPADFVGGTLDAMGQTQDGHSLAELLLREDAGHDDVKEVSFIRHDGAHLHLEARSRRIRFRGEENLVIAMRDVTERKQNEAERARLSRELSLILNSTGEGIVGLDAAGKVRFANRAAARLLTGGTTPLEGKSHEALFHSATEAHDAACPISAAYQRGETHHVSAAVFPRSHGSPLAVDYVSAPIIQDDATTGAVVAFKDIGDRLEIDRMKDEFVSVVSHELKTPLTSMSGALRLLDSGRLGELPPKGARMLKIASENTERLIRLVNDILDVERFRAGKVSLEPSAVDVAALAETARETMAPMATAAHVTLDVQVTATPLRADADRVLQALTNLLSNAIKFSPAQGTVRLVIAPERSDVRISVMDKGPGIPDAHKGRVFERFHQVDSSHAREKGGSGLGLAICRSIAEAHGGTIGVESKFGHGSTFFLLLPASGPPEIAKTRETHP